MKPIILIVDDEEDISKPISRALESGGYFTISYGDSDEVYDAITNGLKYDLAIIDLSLPKRSGDEIISLSKRINPKTPIISLSGYSYNSANSDTPLRKPVLMGTLLRAISNYFPDKNSLKDSH